MAQVNVDPEDLRRFASNLKQFNGDIEQCLQRVHGQFRQLGQSWQDQDYRQFEQIFESTVQQLRRFVQTSEAFIPVLQKKAQAIDVYGNTKFPG